SEMLNIFIGNGICNIDQRATFHLNQYIAVIKHYILGNKEGEATAPCSQRSPRPQPGYGGN
ncbi:MAG: hypothetical protein PHE03_12965, partial [Bacteroidales bacterium]|nr:hypothetical protein [Bacteroidales bacterium]